MAVSEKKKWILRNSDVSLSTGNNKHYIDFDGDVFTYDCTGGTLQISIFDMLERCPELINVSVADKSSPEGVRFLF